MKTKSTKSTKSTNQDGWTNQHGGDWETGSNWSKGAVPKISDDATFALSGIYTVAVLADETVHNLSTAGGATLDITHDLTVTGALNNTGTLDVSGALDVIGAVSGQGSVIIDGSAQVTFENARVSQNVAFNTGTGELVLDASQGYRGTISGFIQQDTLDLTDIAFGITTSAIFSGTGAGGTLTVSDGVHTAKLALAGDYLNSIFTASSDGHGGTLVVDPLVTTNIITTSVNNTIIRSVAIDTIYESTFTNTGIGQLFSTNSVDVIVQFAFTNSNANNILSAINSSNLNLESTLTNSGFVTASGTADITVQGVVTNSAGGNIRVLDSGVVVLERLVNNFGQLAAFDHGVLTVEGNVDNTNFIHAENAGEINLGILANTNTIQNAGTIQADDSSEVNINAGTGSNGGLFNYGTLEANNLATLNITANGFFTNSGTIEANNAGLVAITGNLFNPGTVVANNDVSIISITGNVTNSGVLKTNNGGLLSVGGDVSGGQAQINGTSEIELHSSSNINVNFAHNNEGTLRLDSSQAFNGHVSGFGTGDAIDLAFIPFNGPDTHLTYTANAAGSAGILHVTDNNIAAQTIDIAMVGHYIPAEFHLSDDGHGGTHVTDFLLS